MVVMSDEVNTKSNDAVLPTEQRLQRQLEQHQKPATANSPMPLGITTKFGRHVYFP